MSRSKLESRLDMIQHQINRHRKFGEKGVNPDHVQFLLDAVREGLRIEQLAYPSNQVVELEKWAKNLEE